MDVEIGTELPVRSHTNVKTKPLIFTLKKIINLE
jgi:hypothetical protein